jgi:hypothetical protein
MIVVFFSVFFCCGGLALFGDRPKNGIRVEQLEADLTQQLPDGSTWEQAEVWLASYGVRPIAYYTEGGRKTGLEAVIPNDSLLFGARIIIELHFTPEGRLQKRLIEREVDLLP